MDEIVPRYKNMPVGVRGLTILDSNGDYNVYINSRLCEASRRTAWLHELRHIRRGDFYSDVPIEKCERSE